MALKALLIERMGQFPKVHDLVHLGRLVELDKNLVKECESLTFVYTETRYPDTGLRDFTTEEAEKDLASAGKILEWVASNLS